MKKNKKKRLKTGKRALWLYFTSCFLILLYVMVMLWFDKDSSTLSILAGAAVAALPAAYAIYTANSTKINLKHMEENYNPNYDKEHGLR